ncbi:Cell wall-associated hydrolase, NlpC family [Friedmanniella luteola]|uniref:Cell wall-associated hydrolase, NlpC family n=1 Tax=Friedmanniella luteola TaxID=546871 RepID=A0A1H1P5F5_9ACTN|nr:C40 family peptidase [Friedmanniella luteola]SDS06432.1 Cell wall-associated hydrolase, NlpC family [Friedmanniella luteola]
MTSHRREADHDLRAVRATRTVRKSVIGLSTLALTVATFLPGASTASAAPTAVTIAEAKAQIEQLEVESAAIDQEWVGVKEQLDAGRAKLARKQADVRTQTAKVARVKRQVGQVALAQFQNRNVDTAAQIFFNSDSDNFMSQISTVEKVSENQNTVLQDFQEQQAALAELQHSSETDLATLTEQEKKLAELRADSDAKVAESKKVLARLTAAERAAIAAAEKKAAEEAKKKAEAAAASSSSTTTTGSTSGSTTTTPDTTSGTSAVSGSSRGAKAVSFAKAQLGKPYRFGATGPAAYDCSGLTGAAWKAAGVTLPRTSQSQIGAGRSVSRSELQPGDLVFYYSGISHVALYVGNGQIIHAPNSRSSVKYADVDSMPWAGARRPG